MPTGSGIVSRAIPHLNEQYAFRLVPKDQADYSGPWDCAEFASWLVYQEAGILYGCTNNNSKPSLADAYTGAWRRDSNQLGKRISVEEAATIPGAFLLRYPPSDDSMGHIAISDGKGGTIEAKGKAYGVVRDKVSGRRWNTGVLVPGIDYEAGSEVVLAPPAQLYAMGSSNMDPTIIKEIQTALTTSGFSPGVIDGVFGKQTMEAVARFQRILGLVADGEVGRDTAAKLGVDIAGLVTPIATALGVTVNPLLGLAVNLVPTIIGLLQQDRTGTTANAISAAVERETGTTDPAAAQKKIESDPEVAGAVRQKVEAIAASAEKSPAPAPTKPQEQTASPAPAVSPARAAEVIAAETTSTNFARNFALKIAEQGGPLSRGPLIISILVLLGFYATLVFFLWPRAGTALDPSSREVIYLIIGALTSGFATVISFWLGSSQGSRFKDATSLGSQIERSTEASRILDEQTKTLDAARKTAMELAARPAAKGGEAKSTFSNFEACLAIILRHEGSEYTDHPDDNGGPTRYGITLGTLQAWRRRQGSTAPVTAVDVEKLEMKEVREIYRSRYWNELNCESLPRGVDLVVFDFGVNAGTGASAKMLQKVVGAAPDGSIGVATLAATAAKDPKATIEDISKRRLTFYKGLDDWPTFGRGWSRRTEETRQAALEMAKAG